MENFSIEMLGTPFQLPRFSKTLENIAAFVDLDTRVQLELLREDLNHKACRVLSTPKDAEGELPADKHCRFPMPALDHQTLQLTLPSTQNVHKVPARGQWANYFVVLQTQNPATRTMKHLALVLCSQFRKTGVIFRICQSDMARLSQVPTGTDIYGRPLVNCNFQKIHFRAIQELGDSAHLFEESPVTKQILKGHLDTDIKTVKQLDEWVQGTSAGNGCAVSIDDFNKQQKRALALNALTKEGIVLIQGPPGTGKSHILCHGLIPLAVERNEKMLVICNSNVAVDALMVKCLEIESLNGKMVRCGFKSNISDEIVEKGLFAEGDAAAGLDQYGDRPGSNSNTSDNVVRHQIQSKAVVFTTIHFASKDKGSAASSYWNFDTLVLDEAAQIEDSKLFILLTRCPSLKKIILVGDPKQLQPYVSDSLRRQGHGKSTMERLMESQSTSDGGNTSLAPYVMLEVQFRMAPLLRSLVSELFYDNRLEDAECVLSRGPIDSVALTPLLVINLTGTKMSFSKLHQSYENIGEAKIVREVYNFLFSASFEGALNMEESLTPKDVCVLSPFNRQKDRLRAEICHASFEDLDAHSGHVYGRSLLSPVKKSQSLSGLTVDDGDVGEAQAAQLDNIDTVDKFQGSERKVVIVSTCVDAKPLRAGDPHFINVACSRAQHLLIVVGNFTDALSCDPNWSRMKSKATEEGTYIEHEVNVTGENGEGVNLDVSGLRSKVSNLVARKAKKRKTGLDFDNEE